MAEYAKFVRLYAPTTNGAGRGMQAQFKLPSTKSLVGSYDYINFYCGIGGYEIGISTSIKPLFLSGGVYKWHWFVNTSNGDTTVLDQPVQFVEGDTITVKILLDATTNKLNFFLNGSTTPVYVGSQVYTGTLDNCRIVMGAGQASGTVAPLTAWRIFHDNVTVSNIYYRNASNTWVAMTSGTLDAFHEPSTVSDANTPAPLNYLTSANGSHQFSGGSYTAKLVQP